MSTYSSKPTIVAQPIDQLFERFSDLTNLQRKLRELPEDQLARIGEVNFTPDTMSIITPQVGELKFQVTERQAPSHVAFSAVSSPLPLLMSINFKEVDANSTEVTAAIDVEIPMMLRPLIGGKIQEAADKFGQLMSQLS